MKNKYKFSIVFIWSFFIITGIFSSSVLATPIQHEAYENYYAYKSWSPTSWEQYSCSYDLQGDVVYEDSSGYTEYAIFTSGTNNYVYDVFTTRILVYFYVSAYFKRTHYYPNQYTEYFWDPIPNDLITWTGDWDFQTDHYRWDWTVDSQEKYSNLLGNAFEYGSGTYYSTNSINGDYRYLGYVKVTRNDGFTYYDALIRFHIDNNLAEDYVDGVFGGVPDVSGWVDRIIKFNIKIVTKFQYEFWGWHNIHTETFIFGDGTPSTDLSNIALALGTVEGAS